MLVLAGILLSAFNLRTAVTSLTPRQREILQLLAEGKSAKQISTLLGISTRTVEFHKYLCRRCGEPSITTYCPPCSGRGAADEEPEASDAMSSEPERSPLS